MHGVSLLLRKTNFFIDNLNTEILRHCMCMLCVHLFFNVTTIQLLYTWGATATKCILLHTWQTVDITGEHRCSYKGSFSILHPMWTTETEAVWYYRAGKQKAGNLPPHSESSTIACFFMSMPSTIVCEKGFSRQLHPPLDCCSATYVMSHSTCTPTSQCKIGIHKLIVTIWSPYLSLHHVGIV